MSPTENRNKPRQVPLSSSVRPTFKISTIASPIASAGGPRSGSASEVTSSGCSAMPDARTAGRWPPPSEKCSHAAHSASSMAPAGTPMPCARTCARVRRRASRRGEGKRRAHRGRDRLFEEGREVRGCRSPLYGHRRQEGELPDRRLCGLPFREGLRIGRSGAVSAPRVGRRSAEAL
jgi:hypothetical protein